MVSSIPLSSERYVYLSNDQGHYDMTMSVTRNVQFFCKTCKLCKLNKKTREQYSKIPLKIAEATPWGIVQVDLIGPWKVKTPSGATT
jgi:hypothetical protein